MNEAIKLRIRPLALPILHAWQWLGDYSQGVLRVATGPRYRARVLRSRTVVLRDVRGVRFVFYPYDVPNLRFLLRHPADVAEFRAIPKLVRPGDVTLDVGANIGLYTVLLSQLCGPNGRVWAFEPVLDTYWRLRETLALNRCDNVVPVQAAVCEKRGTVTMSLFEPRFAEWNTMAVPSARPAGGRRVGPTDRVQTPARALDEFCETEGIERINFLKVDAEGFESPVFRGAERLLRERRIDYICFEISKRPLADAGFGSREVFQALSTYGYYAYSYHRRTGTFRGPTHDTAKDWTNLFASWRDLSRPETWNRPRGHNAPSERAEGEAK